jgi:hypothetical protein
LLTVSDLMLITVGSRLLLGAGPRSVALGMLGGHLALELYAGAAYSVQSLNGTYRPGNHLDAVWMASALLLAAGVLHPSAPKLVAASSAAVPDATVGRLITLALAAMVTPATLLVESYTGAPHVGVAAVVCMILFLLVLPPVDDLVLAADRALYAAKNAGRNQVAAAALPLSAVR